MSKFTEETNQNRGNRLPSNSPFNNFSNNNNSTMITGLVLIGAGLLYLIYKMGAPLPWWLFSWPMILLLIAFIQGVKSNWRNPSWVVLLIIGGIFLIEKATNGIHLRNFIVPLILIGLGVIILFTKTNLGKYYGSFNGEDDNMLDSNYTSDRADVVEAISIFGGAKRSIFSKQFRGGEIINVFGGTDLNFMQADIRHTAHIECVNIFGGTKLIVPAHWEVRSEVVSIFGGVSDKRYNQDASQSNKLIVVTGVNIFGGIEIKSY